MSTEIATDDRAATASALRQLHADHANAVEVDDTCTEVNTAALGLALAEIDRLTAELAKYVGWEPTVKDEYEHACAVAERAKAVVKQFDRGEFEGYPFSFSAALKSALEM